MLGTLLLRLLCAARPWLYTVLACALFLARNPAQAAETESAAISFSGHTYQYTFIARLNGSAAAVHEIVTDFDGMKRINDDIVESRVLTRYANGELKRQLKLRHCILVFCFDLNFVERVHESAGHVTTTIVPAESTFLDGTASWRIEALDATHTRISVDARQTPSFWIPPVIGPLILKRVFMAEVAETCANIERIASYGKAHD